MARIDNLNNFLTDVADSIREKKGTTELIPASAFDTEIDSISGGVDINDYYLTSGGYETIDGYIKKIPQLDTSNVTNMNSMFSGCRNLISIPQLNTSNVTNMSNMFNNCKLITTIPLMDTSNVTYMAYMFASCNNLISIPLMDTSKVTAMNSMFYSCGNLISIPQLNLSKVTNAWQMFLYCIALTTLGGFQNLGMAYDTSKSANYSYYTLDLSTSPKLTHDSLMNVINGLYDIKTKGCNPQRLTLGSENLAKLTAEEIAIATNKGWNVI